MHCIECGIDTRNIRQHRHGRIPFGEAVAFRLANNAPFRPGSFNAQKALMYRTV